MKGKLLEQKTRKNSVIYNFITSEQCHLAMSSISNTQYWDAPFLTQPIKEATLSKKNTHT
jgi:hypothetical protein